MDVVTLRFCVVTQEVSRQGDARKSVVTVQSVFLPMS